MRPFEQIVQEYAPTVLRVCRAVLGSRSDAEDASAETFLAALRAYPELDQGANVEAWLVRIAHRKAIDLARSNARRPLAMRHLPERPGDAAPAPEPDGELWSLVATLPAKQRMAVAYHYLAGLPYAEIAEITGGSVAAARRAAADGMKNLRASCRDLSGTGVNE